jgi:DNA-binding MarR family transcriptional regulator
MPPAPHDTAETAFRAFVRASCLFRGQMDPYFARFGISGAQWGVLRTLHRAEGEGLAGLRLTDLGRRLLVRPPSMTSVVDRLERTGLVARRATAADRRAKQVSLTGRGHKLVARVLAQHPRQMHAVMAGLSATEQCGLRRLMERLAEHLEALGAADAGVPHTARQPIEKSTPSERAKP